jgi:phage antirepressor YoqD-like protein
MSTLKRIEKVRSFQKWVTSEVLPSIRKTGSYSSFPNFNDPIVAARAWADAEEQKQILEQRVEIIEPKAAIYDQVLNSAGLILPSIVGKEIMGHPIRFTRWLVDVRVLFRGGRGHLLPFERHQSQGYLTVKAVHNREQDRTYDQTFFTPAGVLWITEKWNKYHHVQSELFAI